MPSKLTIPTAIIPLSLRSLPGLQSKPISSLPSPTHEHIARLIIDQKSASHALQTFRWATKIPNFTHSRSTYRALIYKLCTFRRFDTVRELLDEMPHSIQSPPDESIFITVIRGLGRARMINDVVKATDLVSRFNMTPSLKILNSILDVLVKEDIDLARAFYRKKMMASGVQGDDYTYAILMKGLCLTNRVGDGFKLLHVMKSRGVKPNSVIYNTLIHSLCKNGKVGRARSLMSDMEEPNDVTFSILICAYCKEENLVNALVLLEKSFSFGFVPDVVTITKVLELLCSVGRVTDAVEILKRVESKGGVIDVVAYNTLIKGFCRLGKLKVGCRFLKEMERKGCLPNVDTYNILISSYCETGGRIDDGLKILQLMEDSKEGSKGRISPYNSVLYGLYRENQQDEALEYLKQMEKLFPRAVDRSLKILGFCVDGNVEDAKRCFDQMIEEGGVPNVVIYDCLIHAYCQEERVREASELMKEMTGHGYLPIASTFNTVLSGLCRQGNVGTALKLVEEDMRGIGRGSLPGSGHYSPLIKALCEKGGFQSASMLLVQMVGKGILPDYLTWNSLLICLSQQTTWSVNMSHFPK